MGTLQVTSKFSFKKLKRYISIGENAKYYKQKCLQRKSRPQQFLDGDDKIDLTQQSAK